MDNTILKSLLQKAVRRQQSYALEASLFLLRRANLDDWLTRRIPVILAEECWPLLEDYCSDYDDINDESVGDSWLNRAAYTKKHKEAAVHGYYAELFLRGTIPTAPTAESKMVVAAMQRPNDFYNFIKEKHPDFLPIVGLTTKREYLSVDKCILTAALVMLIKRQHERLLDEYTGPIHEETNACILAAIDKHTLTGKRSISAFYHAKGYSKRSIGYSYFYHVGSKINGHATERSRAEWTRMLEYLFPMQRVVDEDSKAFTSFLDWHEAFCLEQHKEVSCAILKSINLLMGCSTQATQIQLLPATYTTKK